jgi:RNA-directed DNA polymerase
VGELKAPGKSFEISKWAVWEAWEKVKANKGAPGVDGQSVAEFEKDLNPDPPMNFLVIGVA